MEEQTYTVYQIYNKVEKKSYIGSTCNLQRRIKEHKRGKHDWQIDFATHPENWKVNILEDNILLNDIPDKELTYIKKYDSYKNGYNDSEHVNRNQCNISVERTDNHRKHISEGKKKYIFTDEHKRNIGLSGLGRTPWNSNKKLHWVTNGNVAKLIKPEDLNKYISMGYHIGRSKLHLESRKDTIYINNCVDGKYINPDELQKYLDLGYQKGFKPKE